MNYKIYSSWATASNSVFLFVSTFVGPYIIIYSYSKANQMHNVSNLFYFGNNTLHLFFIVPTHALHYSLNY
jgi:hypothetical protein